MLDIKEFSKIIKSALAEDIGSGDITSNLLIPEDINAELLFVSREETVVCGAFVPELVYKQIDKNVVAVASASEGRTVAKNTIISVVRGNARSLLAGERVSLNIMQRMCGVANLTRKYVEAVRGTGVTILDTRKTMPCLRLIDKYAVKIGGGENHRMRLDDMVLIKDNHIAINNSAMAGQGVAAAISKARAGTNLTVVVECDTLEQVAEAIAAKPDRILLDNMSVEMLKQAVSIADGKMILEASGGVNLNNIREIAESGVGYISVGAITHSASAADIGADISFIAG